MLDYLIKNALVYDGTGGAPYEASVGIKGDTIESIIREGELPEAAYVIDAHGRMLTPGFIDIHSHADRNILVLPNADNSLLQGITTFLGGNCGQSQAPSNEWDNYSGREFDTFEDYLNLCRKERLGVNYAPMVGLNALRCHTMPGNWRRPAGKEEIGKMCSLLTDCMEAGAFGMSYMGDPCPSHYASREEFDALLDVLEKYEAQFQGHTRHHQNQWPSEDGRSYYGVHLDEKGEITCGRYHGLVEFMEMFRAHPKVTAVYSHFTNMFYVPMPHRTETEEAMIQESLDYFVNEPAEEGYRVYFNVLVHQHSLSGLKKVVSEFMRSMSNDPEMQEFAKPEILVEKLKSSEFREKFRKYIKSGKVKINYTCPAQDPYWSDCLMFFKAKDETILNKSLLDVTKERFPEATRHELIYERVYEVLFDLILNDADVAWALVKDKREYQGTRKFAENPRCMPMTDSIIFEAGADPFKSASSYGIAPLSYTTMVRWLVDQSKKDGNLSTEEAVHRMTGLPAEVLKLKDRGLIRTGMKADLNLIDWDALGYTVDFTNPSVPPTGIEYVWVNGVPALKDGKLTYAGTGRVITRP